MSSPGSHCVARLTVATATRMRPSLGGAAVTRDSFSRAPGIIVGCTLTAIVAVGIALAAGSAFADDVVPLTDEHWRGAPATVVEQETGVPAATIDRLRR